MNNVLLDNSKLVSAGGDSLHPIGPINARIRYGGRTVSMPLIICPGVEDMLMSCVVCKELGILPPNYPEPLRHMNRMNDVNEW